MASDNKYDRQLRLWGSDGQKALMEAHVCLLTAGPTGTETLKNLVLPGIGQITVVDDATVSARDLKNNFFVEPSSVGQPRAKATQELLVEMNPDVKGSHRVANPSTLIDSEPDFFSAFTVVVATQLPEKAALALGAICDEKNIPLVLVRSYGFIGYVRNFIKEQTVVEPMPKNRVQWLPLRDPWAELSAWATKQGWGKDMEQHAYQHTPYPVVLIQCTQEWQAAHGGKLPSDTDQAEFRALIKSKARLGWTEEENLLEAHEFAYFVTIPMPIVYTTREVYDDAKAMTLTAATPRFWFVTRAIADFIDNEGAGKVPVCPTLPDMVATSAAYQELQDIFKAKADADAAVVETRVRALQVAAGLDESAISSEYIKLVCKHAHEVTVVRNRTLKEEMSEDSTQKDEVEDALDDAMGDKSQVPALWYLMLRAADAFHATTGRFPGDCDDSGLAADAAVVAKHAAALAKSYNLPDDALTASHATEITRYGGCEIHNIAAFVGGVAAQEIVKMVTTKYVPNNNTFVFNGISGHGGRYNF